MPNIRGFKFGLINVNRLLTHIDELLLLVFDLQFDVFSIKETKLGSTIDNGLVRVDGCSTERNDRNINGGGVALYIHENINYVIRNDLV